APSFAYYMLPTRAGELLTGALLAHGVNAGWRPTSRTVAEAAAWSGLVLVVGSLWWLSEQRVFPGWQAVPPTLGTALLIFAGLDARATVSRLFQRQPLVFIGLLSYSAYLIHWPILAFLRYAGVPIGPVVGVIAVALTIFLAWLSYRFVEQPLRRTRAGAMAVFIRQYALPAGALMFLALVAMKLDGYGPRAVVGSYPERLAEVREGVRPPYAYDYVCQKTVITREDFDDPGCVIGEPGAQQPSVLLVGDSIAAQYVGMLGVFGREAGFAFTNIAASACPTLTDDPATYVTAPRVANCRKSLAGIMPQLADYDVLVIGSAWSYYHGRSPTFFAAFEAAMAPLLAAGKQIIVIAKPPLIPGYDRLCREKAVGLPFMDCHLAPVTFDPDVREGNRRLGDYAARTPGVTLFDPNPVLCPDDRCPVFEADGTPVYYDRSHLTIPASWRLGEAIVARGGVPPVFGALGARKR
ncbi:MAG: acyltransferase family protein, partial [Pseudomonadota bacterium]